MMKQPVIILSVLLLVSLTGHSQMITPSAKKVQGYMPENAVIAHRGTIYWAPELTEAAFRWARNTGADYLELDVQRSKDGVLIIMHDKTFKRTTDVGLKYPGRENDPISSFTFTEIMTLDAGSSFNAKNPEQARAAFIGQDVLVFEDVFRIAEGKRIRRDQNGVRITRRDAEGKYIFEYENDPAGNGHRPGVYIEIKINEEYPGIEEQVYNALAQFGWNPLEGAKRGKILVQTFSRPGMVNIKRVFKEEVPVSFLIGNPKTNEFAKPEVLDEIISFALESGAQFIGTNLGDANDGLTPLFSEKIRAAGLRSNVYSFNTTEQMAKYFGPGKGKRAAPLTDGMITNRAELTINFYNERKARKIRTAGTPEETLDNLGYTR